MSTLRRKDKSKKGEKQRTQHVHLSHMTFHDTYSVAPKESIANVKQYSDSRRGRCIDENMGLGLAGCEEGRRK